MTWHNFVTHSSLVSIFDYFEHSCYENFCWSFCVYIYFSLGETCRSRNAQSYDKYTFNTISYQTTFQGGYTISHSHQQYIKVVVVSRPCQHLVYCQCFNFSHHVVGIYWCHIILFYFICFLGPHLQHKEVPRLGVKSEL